MIWPKKPASAALPPGYRSGLAAAVLPTTRIASGDAPTVVVIALLLRSPTQQRGPAPGTRPRGTPPSNSTLPNAHGTLSRNARRCASYLPGAVARHAGA